ncbi:hypothetical protein D3C86_1369080 [compost metagenome]
MWKPASPIVIGGRALTDREAWWHEFKEELHDQCSGEVDSDWLNEICHAIYPLALTVDPRQMAQIAYVVLMFEPAEFVELQHAARAQALHLKSSGPWRSRCPGPWRQRW